MARDTTEGVTCLDIRYFHRKKLLKLPHDIPQRLTWYRNDEPRSSISFTIRGFDSYHPEAIRLQYSTTHGDEKTSCDYDIKLDRTPCNYGNWRYWWICPLWHDGRACGRRCSVLYLPFGATYFGCRICYDLTYESCRHSGNSFYEGVGRPLDALQRFEEKYARSRSLRKRMKLLDEALWAQRVLKQGFLRGR
jgi:hypothetical protein